MAVDIAAAHQVLMIEIVNAIMVSVVMNSAKAMGTRIVPICKQAAEPPAVPRSSSIATVLKTTSEALSAPTPTSRASSRLCLSLPGDFFFCHSRAATRESR